MPPVRRFLAVMIAALLAGVFAVTGISATASAAGSASLKIVSVTDKESLLGWPVQEKPFSVVVAVVNAAGKPTTVSESTTIKLTASGGAGVLSGNTTATIPANGSSATIAYAEYSRYGNGVLLTVSAVPGGTRLTSANVTVEVALTAVGEDATPKNSLELTDSTCIEPTAGRPTCGQLVLPNGASGRVVMSLGSCDGLGKCRDVGTTEALVVTAIAILKDSANKPLYDNDHPATLIVACDKALCRDTSNGVPRLPLIYTLNNTGSLTQTAQPCPRKGVIGAGQTVCVDYVQSHRQDGDLYTYLLFDYDLRASHP
jgi:hypothetical protein